MPSRRIAEHGFTLFELMVVIAIIGVASAAVVISLPDPHGRVLDDAQRFAAQANAARDDAIVQARPMSVVVTSSGYTFAARVGGAWQPLDERPFVSTDWRSGANVLVGPSGQLRLTFDSTGIAVDPADLVLERNGARETIRVGADGRVSILG